MICIETCWTTNINLNFWSQNTCSTKFKIVVIICECDELCHWLVSVHYCSIDIKITRIFIIWIEQNIFCVTWKSNRRQLLWHNRINLWKTHEKNYIPRILSGDEMSTISALPLSLDTRYSDTRRIERYLIDVPCLLCVWCVCVNAMG